MNVCYTICASIPVCTVCTPLSYLISLSSNQTGGGGFVFRGRLGEMKMVSTHVIPVIKFKQSFFINEYFRSYCKAASHLIFLPFFFKSPLSQVNNSFNDLINSIVSTDERLILNQPKRFELRISPACQLCAL